MPAPLPTLVTPSLIRNRVLAHEILAQQLLVETEDHRRLLIPAADVLTVLKRGMGDGGDQESGGRSQES